MKGKDKDQQVFRNFINGVFDGRNCVVNELGEGRRVVEPDLLEELPHFQVHGVTPRTRRVKESVPAT